MEAGWGEGKRNRQIPKVRESGEDRHKRGSRQRCESPDIGQGCWTTAQGHPLVLAFVYCPEAETQPGMGGEGMRLDQSVCGRKDRAPWVPQFPDHTGSSGALQETWGGYPRTRFKGCAKVAGTGGALWARRCPPSHPGYFGSRAARTQPSSLFTGQWLLPQKILSRKMPP